MKKHLYLLVIAILFSITSNAQIFCFQCFEQNNRLNPNSTNKILNNSFENLAVTGITPYYYCPVSGNYSGAINNWVCNNGGPSTYAQLFSSLNCPIPDGLNAAYMGNFFCNPCTDTVNNGSQCNDDSTCLVYSQVDCRVGGIPAGFPFNTNIGYGGSVGVSLEQTVTGLSVDSLYTLEFWTGGEYGGFFWHDGVFAVDVGFGREFITNPPTDPGMTGRRFMISFKANATSHTIKFINYGHICSYCSEPILDDVYLYPCREATTTPITCTFPVNPPPPPPPPPTPTPTPIAPLYHVAIPNAFSPNGDGRNDYFTVLGDSISTIQLDIYDRWGELVYSSNNNSKGWDGYFRGKAAPLGVYVYYTKGTYINGETFSFTGNVTLVK